MTFIYVRRSQWFCVVIMFTAFLLSWIWYDFWLRGTRARDFQPVWPIIFLLHYIIDLPPSWLCQPLVIFTSKVCFPNTKSIITHGESNKESFQQNNLTPRCPLVVGEVCVHHITKPFFRSYQRMNDRSLDDEWMFQKNVNVSTEETTFWSPELNPLACSVSFVKR